VKSKPLKHGTALRRGRSIARTPEQLLNILKRIVNIAEYIESHRDFYERGMPAPSGDSIEPIDRIQHFRSAIFSGALPDADTLLFVAMGFNRYLTAASRKVDLDKAFKLRASPKASHPAVRLKAKSELGSVLSEMAYIRGTSDGRKLSLQASASKAIGSSTRSVSSVVNAYKRHDFRKLEAMIRKNRQK
jgi:hypothetical protein